MINWQDASHYSKGDTARIPTIYRTMHEEIDITVHRHIHYPPDVWLLSSNGLQENKHVLKSKEIEKAKEEAIRFVLEKIKKRIHNLQSALSFYEKNLGFFEDNLSK